MATEHSAKRCLEVLQIQRGTVVPRPTFDPQPEPPKETGTRIATFSRPGSARGPRAEEPLRGLPGLARVDDVSGSIQRVGQADSVLLVKGEKVGGRTVSSTVTFAKLREEPDDYPAPVKFAIDGTSIGVDAAPVDSGKDAKRDREDEIGARAARLHVKLAMADDYPRGIAKEALVKLMGGNAVRRRREIDRAALCAWIVNAGPRTPYVLGAEPPPPEHPCSKCQGTGEVTIGRKPPGPCFACHGSGEGI